MPRLSPRAAVCRSEVTKMYGLLGKSLAHSFSKTIHEHLREGLTYHLYETADVQSFLQVKSFRGINVTHPYKKAVMSALDELDETAKRTGIVNTIIRQNGSLKGHNTDYLALDSIIRRHFPRASTKVAIVGNGATMRSAKVALADCGYTEVDIFARRPHAGEYPLEELEGAYGVLINTTPVGMYPDNASVPPVDFGRLTDLTLVFDVIYNPLKTRLLQKAEAAGIRILNGLEMLVRQAAESQALFFGEPLDDLHVAKALAEFEKRFLNIVLIGLPFAGKTHYGLRLAKETSKPFIDIDREIEKQQGTSVENIFRMKGEKSFRGFEKEKVMEIAKRHGQWIAPGGGIVEDEEAMLALKQNGILVFLDLDESILSAKNLKDRPLIEDMSDLKELKRQRQSLYETYADVTVAKDTWKESTIIRRIKEALDAHLDS